MKNTEKDVWKILIVDDEEDVHKITSLVLNDFIYQKKSLHFLNAYSGEECKKILEKNPDIALILLDVVMETDDTGLKLIDYIRNEKELHEVRIILRTGQPGYAPERYIIDNFDIDDYKTKTELTAQKLYTTVRSALKNYHDIRLAQTNKRSMLIAEAASEAKSRFLAHISHEIRTPIHGIIGLTEIVQETPITKDQGNLIKKISLEANTLLHLINQILDLSKIEAGKLNIEKVNFNLSRLLAYTVDSLAFQANQKGLKLNLLIKPDVPLYISGDPLRLRQIIVNIVGNAIKFTESGEIFIKVEHAETREDKEKIRFSIKDTGIGIEKEKQKTIFDSFTQADSSTSRKYGGTGLGTTISKQLCELMGGNIGFESKVGEGTTFWFTACFKKQEEGAISDKQIKEKITSQISPSPIYIKGALIRILLAEDNPVNHQIAVHHLENEGYDVKGVGNGIEAVEAFKSNRYDIVLMDVEMPGMDGNEATKLIRKFEKSEYESNNEQPGIQNSIRKSRTPIIAMTAHTANDFFDKCIESGMNDCMTKPLKRDNLIGIVEK